jgi:hypothetical protein
MRRSVFETWCVPPAASCPLRPIEQHGAENSRVKTTIGLATEGPDEILPDIVAEPGGGNGKIKKIREV